ncbi:hypothetical protein [Meiothermus taiwanensis]|uniref:hypothetical protein n=1 Tax=Meiothermus taiwanensis TaxID=172827 RepID=UPI001F51A727|nr:hypothetical protein [Meiothermus taiwanensis]
MLGGLQGAQVVLQAGFGGVELNRRGVVVVGQLDVELREFNRLLGLQHAGKALEQAVAQGLEVGF